MNYRQVLQLFFEFVALLSGIVVIKKLDKKLLILFVFVCVAFFTESVLSILMASGIKNTLAGLHIYAPIEFLLFSLMYLFYFRSYGKFKWIRVIIIVFLIFSVINPLFLQDLYEFSNTRAFSSFLLTFFAILYFYNVLFEIDISELWNEPMIWVNTAVLLYFAGNFFFFLLFSFILDYSREFSKITVVYFTVLNSIFYTLIAIGFYKAGKQKKLKPQL